MRRLSRRIKRTSVRHVAGHKTSLLNLFMYYVYIIKSELVPDKFYVGYSLDVKSRLIKHNEGGSIYTKDYKPWTLVFCSVFKEKHIALGFEKYLKSHSGRSFMKKRLV